MDELYEQRCIKTRVYKKCPDETSHDTLHKFAGNIQINLVAIRSNIGWFYTTLIAKYV